MDGIIRTGRMLIAYTLTLGSTTLFTPLWLIRGLFLRKKGKGYPNLLQYILTGVARETLRWQARLGAQPGHYTRDMMMIEKWLSPSSSLVFIEPAGKIVKDVEMAGQTGFDDSMLPVKLNEKERSKKTAGLWYRNKRDSSLMTKRISPVVLYFHGGAYITLDPDDVFMGVTAARNHAHYGQVDVLSIAYRLAPGSKFPSQLFEAYSAFLYLKQQEYTSIVIGGDSAGANLALTLWRYLDEVTNESNFVSSLLLYSPWLDMQGFERDGFKTQVSSCAITKAYVYTGFTQMQTNGLPQAQDSWISPINWSLQLIQRMPPIFVSHGGEETLVEEGLKFIQKARDQGVQVQHFLKQGYPHDYQCLPWFPFASAELFTASGQFIAKHQTRA